MNEIMRTENLEKLAKTTERKQRRDVVGRKGRIEWENEQEDRRGGEGQGEKEMK
jgi:hypothetical protein